MKKAALISVVGVWAFTRHRPEKNALLTVNRNKFV